MISHVKANMKSRVLLLRKRASSSSIPRSSLRDFMGNKRDMRIRNRGSAIFRMVSRGIRYFGFLPYFCKMAAMTAYTPSAARKARLT